MECWLDRLYEAGAPLNEILLENVVEPSVAENNWRAMDLDTPLHQAVHLRKYSAVRWLLRHGVVGRPSARDGKLPVDLANGDPVMLHLLRRA